jgi:hypothetical protein
LKLPGRSLEGLVVGESWRRGSATGMRLGVGVGVRWSREEEEEEVEMK